MSLPVSGSTSQVVTSTLPVTVQSNGAVNASDLIDQIATPIIRESCTQIGDACKANNSNDDACHRVIDQVTSTAAEVTIVAARVAAAALQ